MPTAARKSARAKFEDVPLAELVRDPKLQMRAASSEEHARDIADAVAARKEVRRVKVVNAAGRKYVVDGFHTVRGYELLGRKAVPCAVTLGTWEDAVLAALGANQEHTALKRTNADKRRAVERALAEFPKWSNRKVAEVVGVSHVTVAAARTDLVSGGQLDHLDAREGKDGKVYPARTSGGDPAADPMDEPWREALVGTGYEPTKAVAEAIDAADIESVGDLIEAIERDDSFHENVGRAGLDGLRDALKDLMAAREPEEPEAPTRTRGGKPKPVLRTADRKGFERELVHVLRHVDAVAKKFPNEVNGRDHRNLSKTINDLRQEFEAWADRLEATKKAAS